VAHEEAPGLDWSPVIPVSALRRLTPWLRCGHLACTQDFSDEPSKVSSGSASLISCTGDEITYAPLAHFPRSTRRQRSLQKGKSAFALVTFFLQIGQRRVAARLRGMDWESGFRYDLGHKVVVVRLGDLATIEFAGFHLYALGYVVHEDLAINFRSVHGSAALKQEVALLRPTFK